jgi:phosphatidylglycerol---prolipoprotein diacylglyceryl transferase
MPLALIPGFQLPSLHLGFLTIQSFGILTALGVLTGVYVAGRAARQMGRDPQVVMDFAVVGVLSGVVFGHLVHVLFYHPEELAGWQVLKFWEGLSSMGGLVGGVVAALLWFRWKRIPFTGYSDALALGMAPGWGIARVGCFTVHDHPGIRTDFFLAVNIDGVPRHDLGLYDAIVLFSLAALLWTLHRRGILRGRLLVLLGLLYGTARFCLDFLRARPGDVPYADARYLGLTPAQYIVVVVVACSIYRLATFRPAAAVAHAGKPARRASVPGA